MRAGHEHPAASEHRPVPAQGGDSVAGMSDLRTIEANGLLPAYRESGEPGGDPRRAAARRHRDSTDRQTVAEALAVHSIELMRDDTPAFPDALRVGKVTLIGQWLGGVVGCLTAARAPERVSGLVLEDPATPDPADPPREVPLRAEGEETYDWRTYAARARWRNAPDPGRWDLFPAVTCPTPVIAGGPAGQIPQDRIALLAERIPDARLLAWESPPSGGEGNASFRRGETHP
jgi:pimeloyl-ACP methyl ester carboxylesterase